jgi:hypothetical protein
MEREFWERVFSNTPKELIREMIHSIKAAEAEELFEQGRALAYVLERADLMDVLVYLGIDHLPATLCKNQKVVIEGDLLEIAAYLSEQEETSGYTVTLASQKTGDVL